MPRPKEFDVDEVLDRAMDYFWSHGYLETSIQDLTEHLGLLRGSLYNAFKDKRTLFLACLERYTQKTQGWMLRRLEAPDAGLSTVEEVIKDLVLGRAEGTDVRGCLVTNTAAALSGEDQELALLLEKKMRRVEEAFARALEQARERGELGPDRDPRALSRFIVSNLQGLFVLKKMPRGAEEILEITETMLSVLR